MAKKYHKKIGPIERISNVNRIGGISRIEKFNTIDVDRRKALITDLDNELLEYHKLLNVTKKIEKARSAITDSGTESKFEKILQSKLSNKEEFDEEIPVNNQGSKDVGIIIDIKI